MLASREPRRGFTSKSTIYRDAFAPWLASCPVKATILMRTRTAIFNDATSATHSKYRARRRRRGTHGLLSAYCRLIPPSVNAALYYKRYG